MDAVTVQIIRNKVASLVDEMHYRFYRSGYSTVVRESRDFSCVVLDTTGRLIVPPPMFFHAPVYKHMVGRILELYGADNLKLGDMFVANHPYEAGLPHVSDMGFVSPVFAEGKLIAFVGSIAHKADIGGTNPGSTSGSATELYHEGLLLPPIRIMDAGRRLEDIDRLICANSRQPITVMGDINAQMAAIEMGVERIGVLSSRFGNAAISDAFATILDGAATQLRAALKNLPDGTFNAKGCLDSDGVDLDTPIHLEVTVRKQGSDIEFDFTQCGPQAKGPVNLRPAMVEACVFYSLISCVDPSLQFNDGIRDVVRLTLAPDTITNASAPAPVSNYMMVNRRLVDLTLEALSQLNPVRAIAHCGSSNALGIAWQKSRPGHPSMQYELVGSGAAYGGGNGKDGTSGTATHMSNVHITPIEILETEFPCRVVRFDLVPDSGGKGRWRGGLSIRREYELLEDATVNCRFEKTLYPPRGVAGGENGARSRIAVFVNSENQRDLKASSRLTMKAGDHLLLECASGGGYGDPAQRDPQAIEHDLAEGYLTAAPRP